MLLNNKRLNKLYKNSSIILLSSIIILLYLNVYLSHGNNPYFYKIIPLREGNYSYQYYIFQGHPEANGYAFPIIYHYEDANYREYRTESKRVNGKIEQSYYPVYIDKTGSEKEYFYKNKDGHLYKVYRANRP